MDSLYQRLGGDTVAQRVVDAMYDKVLADSQLCPFFDGVDTNKQRAKFRAFFDTIIGAPGQRSGIELRAAHSRSVDAGLNHRHVEMFGNCLRAALAESGVSDPISDEIMANIRRVEGEVLGI